MNSNKDLESLRKRMEHMEHMEREYYYAIERLVNWCYALTGIIIMLLVVLSVLICNIYFRLGVIPDWA